MGYYTYYTLHIKEASRADVENIWVYANDECPDFPHIFGKEVPKSNMIDSESPYQWSGFLDDMVKISEAFPHVLFVLHGEGDSPEDLWNAYFQIGKYQMCRAEIIYPEYDPSKMISFGEEEA